MSTNRTAGIVLMMITALAFGAAPTKAGAVDTPVPAHDDEDPMDINVLISSCCSKCQDAAKELCKGGKVKDFDCGGFPCECRFDCALVLSSQALIADEEDAERVLVSG